MFKDRKKLKKIVMAIGGFLMMNGIVILGLFALDLFNIADLTSLMNTDYQIIFATALLVTGILDFLAWYFLSRG